MLVGAFLSSQVIHRRGVLIAPALYLTIIYHNALKSEAATAKESKSFYPTATPSQKVSLISTAYTAARNYSS